MFQGIFKDDSRRLSVVQGSFNGIQKRFQEDLEGVSRQFQACLKTVSSGFQ